MTKLLELAVDTASTLPVETQNALARMKLQLAGDESSLLGLTQEDDTSFAESFAQAARGEFASEAQVRAIWAKHEL